MTDKTCSRCKGTAIDPEHSGVEHYGDGIVRPVPEPCSACQMEAAPRCCFSCGHPWDAHDTRPDGNRSCRSVGHQDGVSCADCRAMLTTEYRDKVQQERDADWFQAVWGAYTVILADARHAFGDSAPAFFSDIHQSALASALIAYREKVAGLESKEPTT